MAEPSAPVAAGPMGTPSDAPPAQDWKTAWRNQWASWTFWPRVFVILTLLPLLFCPTFGSFVYTLVRMALAGAAYYFLVMKYQDTTISGDFLIGQIFWISWPVAAIVGVTQFIISFICVVFVFCDDIKNFVTYLSDLDPTFENGDFDSLTKDQQRVLYLQIAEYLKTAYATLPQAKFALVSVLLSVIASAFIWELAKYLVTRRVRGVSLVSSRGVVAASLAVGIGASLVIGDGLYGIGVMRNVNWSDVDWSADDAVIVDKGSFLTNFWIGISGLPGLLVTFAVVMGMSCYMGSKMALSIALNDPSYNFWKMFGVLIGLHTLHAWGTIVSAFRFLTEAPFGFISLVAIIARFGAPIPIFIVADKAMKELREKENSMPSLTGSASAQYGTTQA